MFEKLHMHAVPKFERVGLNVYPFKKTLLADKYT